MNTPPCVPGSSVERITKAHENVRNRYVCDSLGYGFFLRLLASCRLRQARIGADCSFRLFNNAERKLRRTENRRAANRRAAARHATGRFTKRSYPAVACDD